jgi:hypothetical protein
VREHWENCITHRDAEVGAFIDDYFADGGRHALLIAGAGFDPRSTEIPKTLAAAMDDRLQAIFLREEREPVPETSLKQAADGNESRLRELVPRSESWQVEIFAADNAPVGGTRIAELLGRWPLPVEITDIILDISALSLGIAFPAARILLAWAEERPEVSFHLVVASNPSLDAQIVPEPVQRSQPVRGFSGPPPGRELPPAKVWLPQLAPQRVAMLERIRVTLQGDVETIYKICPVLPFPAQNPRRADDLIREFRVPLRDEWGVDSRDYIYVSESNPLDSYRTITALKHRLEKAMSGSYETQLILSPLGSKVMAVGALMAAIRHNLPVHYVEALRYDHRVVEQDGEDEMRLVHLWLDGPVYSAYPAPTAVHPEPAPV